MLGLDFRLEAATFIADKNVSIKHEISYLVFCFKSEKNHLYYLPNIP